ncbi:MAG: hypothetical protein JXA18_11880 [Chitinispirillaceae bacterium]|nr:hypothetical protein [Chitinispirillaceae bacterium]
MKHLNTPIIFFSVVIGSGFSVVHGADMPGGADIIVAKDNTGKYATVQQAVNAVPQNSSERTVIYIKNGTYKEVLTLESNKKNVTIIGESRDGVTLTYDNYASKPNPATGSEFGTSGSSSQFINGEGFCALNITFENSAGPVGQAVAARITGDKAIFYNCRFLGRQDTWYGIGCRIVVRNCYLEGTTDFMFGSATTWFDSCTIHSYGGTALTAASTEQYVPYGFVYRSCNITGESGVSTSLGRPWRPYSAVSFQYCDLSSCIKPAGWDNWGDAANERTARYSEYKNTGSGANTGSRVSWAKQLSDAEAEKYTLANVMKTTYRNPPVTDNWDPLKTLSLYTSPATGTSHGRGRGAAADRNTIVVSGGKSTLRLVNNGAGGTPVSLSLLSFDGRVVRKVRTVVDGGTSFPLRGISRGMYFAVAEAGGCVACCFLP